MGALITNEIQLQDSKFFYVSFRWLQRDIRRNIPNSLKSGFKFQLLERVPVKSN